ncbi:MAG TPA: hypothetical protein VF723_14400 [Pyrinomonadaceae bacterium]
MAQTRINGKILFSRGVQGTNALFTMNADGSNLTQISTNCYNNAFPEWSPDGTQVVFTGSCTEGNSQIYLINADGSGLRRLTNYNGFNEHPTWSPDGTRIAFDRSLGDGIHLFVINVDSTGERRLTTNPAANDVSPAWSPDGSKIAFAHINPYNGQDPGKYNIYVINTDGSNQINLTNNAFQNYNPAWSPDGTKITFSSTRNGQQNIYVMNADGSNQTKIAALAGDSEPSWSPDGTKIVFVSLVNGNADLYLVNPDGSNLTRLSSNSSHENSPSWQPMLALNFNPTLITESGTNRALALDSVTFTRDPFPAMNYYNLSMDRPTRVMLFAVYTDLAPGEDASAVTVVAEDSQNRVYLLPVEYVGKVPGFSWLTQVTVRLPEELAKVGNVMVSISLHGKTSSKVALQVN